MKVTYDDLFGLVHDTAGRGSTAATIVASKETGAAILTFDPRDQKYLTDMGAAAHMFTRLRGTRGPLLMDVGDLRAILDGWQEEHEELLQLRAKLGAIKRALGAT